MDLKKLFIENGEMNFEKKFISVRILREALMSRFRVRVIEETSKCFSCKIFRMARLFGGPMPFPNPVFNFEIIDEGENSIIRYEFISHDYSLLVVSALCFLVLVTKYFDSSGFLDGLLEGISVSGVILVFGFIAIKLDSIYFVHLIRKNFKKKIVDV